MCDVCGCKKNTIRILSNNIWWCDFNTEKWESIGADCSAATRAKGFVRTYKELCPDIIGLQECTAKMSHELMTLIVEENMPYAFLWGRDTPILYRKDKFELVDSESRIYPEAVPGFEGSFNNAKTKSYCIGMLRCKTDGKLLCFATTHLWYKSTNPKSQSYQPYSDEARKYQLNLLVDRVEEFSKKYECKSVIVGDLNDYYESLAVKSALEKGYVHGHDVSVKAPDETSGMHFCCNEGFNLTLNDGGFNKAIDHILVKGFETDEVLCFERLKEEWYMPLSDHMPVWIDIEI